MRGRRSRKPIGFRQWVVHYCIGLTEIDIPDGVTEMLGGAFNNCTGLVTVNLPDSITLIDTYAFAGCSNIKHVYYAGTKEQWDKIDIRNDVSDESNEPLLKAIIHFNDGTMINGSEGDYQYRILTSDDIGDTIEIAGYAGTAKILDIPSEIDGKRVTGIGQNAFYKNEGLTQINIPSSVTNIGEQAFFGCNGLTQINIPDGVINIADGTFIGCQSLIKIRIPDKVTKIGSNAFSSCKKLTEISLPDAVTDIGMQAFSSCESLAKINLPANLKSIGALAFMDCKALTRISIPDGVTSIGNGVFGNCWSLVEVVIPDSVTSIGISTFYMCTSLTKINLPADLVSIGDIAFGKCTSLTEITFPNGLTSIGNQAFTLCGSLTEINLPDSVTSIGSRGFWSCTNLAEISIPASVADIGKEAFENCENLSDVYYSGTKEQWDKIEIGDSNEELLSAVIHYKDVEPQPPVEEIILPTTSDAKKSLEELKAGDSLSLAQDFQNYLSEGQIDIIESCLYTWLAEINYAYKYTGDSDVKKRIMKKAGINPDGDFASGKEQAVTHISVWTKYGPKTLEITLNLGKPDGTGNLYPAYGEMHYEILEKRGLPSTVPKNGRIGKDSYTDMETFINSVAQSAEDSLHGTFHWQELEGWMTANILTDKTVSEIIGNKNGCFVNGTFIVYEKPLFTYSKKVTIACPVDVHVYSMDGTEAGSIVNNEPQGGNQNVQLDVEGDTKIVYLAGDDYYLNLCGTDTGTMRYEVEEIANEEVQRDVQFLELQLKKDMQYEGYVFRPLNIDSDLYALRTVGSTGQEVFYAAEDKQQQALSLFKRVEGLTLGQGSTSVDEGRTLQMSASVSPLDASNPDLQWSTNDESVVKVDSNGMVTAVGAGRATVTVSTKDGSFLKQFCIIDVAGKTSEPVVEPDKKPGGNPGTAPGGSSGTTPGGNVSVTPGGNTTVKPGNDNPSNNDADNPTKPPLEEEPSIVSLSYVLQFNVNGGTGLSRATMTLLAGDCPGIMPKARRKGYTFDGWFTRQEGGTRISGDKPLEQAATLYAQWTKVAAPAKAAAPTLKSKKKGQIKVGLKKTAGAAGYQIVYSTSRNFKSAKTKTAGASAQVKTLTGLKAGKKYYVRVRAYKVDSTNSRIYGAYSAVKSVKVKGK